MLLDGQRYRLLGLIFEDGYFSLTSRVYTRRYLRVSIKGLPAPPLPLRINGRLTLTGRVRRDGSYAGVTAEVTATWEDVFKDILTLRLGKEAPARLQLRSDGRFAIKGDVEADFFNGAAVLKGKADVTQDYCRLEGSFSCSMPPRARTPLISLSVEGKGEVGPGEHFEFEGGAKLNIGGWEISEAHAKMSEREAEVEGQLEVWGPWSAGSLYVPCKLSATLKGHVNLRSARAPEFTFAGAGKLILSTPEMRISGSITVSTESGQLTTVAEGELEWNPFIPPDVPYVSQVWVGGRVRLGDNRVSVSGRTSFVVKLDDRDIGPTTISPQLRVDVEGGFDFDAGVDSIRLSGLRLKAHAVLGISTQGGPEEGRQVLPVAVGSIDKAWGSRDVSTPGAGDTGGPPRLTLLNFRGLGVLSLETLWQALKQVSVVPTGQPLRIPRYDLSKFKRGSFPSLDVAQTTTNDLPILVPKDPNSRPPNLTPVLSYISFTHLTKLELTGGELPSFPEETWASTPFEVPTGFQISLPQNVSEGALTTVLPGFSVALVWDPAGRFRIEVET
jgi:hypothetical protein